MSDADIQTFLMKIKKDKGIAYKQQMFNGFLLN